ncbi:MAG: energy-coupling factor ABC transporter permease, partial [Candidatus Lokiarchaeota archaeon]|nr:energy-coupling factor ABC transporter permease [Candidatus Lokiarchaeota archaeon]
MHIPDGIFPIEQAIIYLVVAVIFLAYSIYRVGKTLEDKHIPLLGVLAAGIFAAQMFNFPVPFGSSGHLVGTALATAYVGPA